ncbi:MAG: hypothetical protein AB1611_00205 [bacterium]
MIAANPVPCLAGGIRQAWRELSGRIWITVNAGQGAHECRAGKSGH